MRVFMFKMPWRSLAIAGLIILITLVLNWNSPAVQQVVSMVANSRLIPIYRVGTEEKKIAISFDATWGTDLTNEILEILEEHDITTTFFLAGYWIDKHPEYVVAIAEAGHEIGNHSYSHPHMNSLTTDGVIRELEKNHAMIKDLTGQEAFLFRPPFGEYNNTVIQAAESVDYYTIQWSIDSLDWKNTTSQAVYDRVMNRIRPGEIILFHNAAKPTPDALRRMLPELKGQGYEIVPISQLIYKDNYYIEHDGTQRLRRGGSL